VQFPFRGGFWLLLGGLGLDEFQNRWYTVSRVELPYTDRRLLFSLTCFSQDNISVVWQTVTRICVLEEHLSWFNNSSFSFTQGVGTTLSVRMQSRLLALHCFQRSSTPLFLGTVLHFGVLYVVTCLVSLIPLWGQMWRILYPFPSGLSDTCVTCLGSSDTNMSRVWVSVTINADAWIWWSVYSTAYAASSLHFTSRP
jgi:hypothetical protein